MSKQDNKSLALLPNGFADLLPKEAEKEVELIRILIDIFSSFGYRRVKPPLVEFEDSLLAPGPGERLASETFRLMDPVTHRMLGVRSDITAQISRIVSSRLAEVPRPLRLVYANDVLRTKGSQMRTERQFTQVGCEFVGDTGCTQSDVEICVLALLGISAMDLGGITLDFTIPGFVEDILCDVDEETRAEILKSVAQRDSDNLLSINVPQAKQLSQVVLASGEAAQALDILEGMSFGEEIKARLARVRAVHDGVLKAMGELGVSGVSLTLDLLEQEGFEYHKEIGFTLFSEGARGELGRGGCYEVRFGSGEQVETAKGFTLYMDTISRSCALEKAVKRVFVPCCEAWSVLTELQKDGWVVVRGTSDGDVAEICTHIYENGRVNEIK